MWRIWSVFTFFVAIYLLIIGRLFYWQVVVGDRLRLEAASQYHLEFKLPAARGQIEASDGHPLAMNQPGYLVYAQPQEIKNKQAFVDRIAPSLKMEPGDIAEIINQPDRVWVPLAHKADQTAVDDLKAYGIAGLGFEKEPKRYYPEASMAAHILGFVGFDQNGADKGYFGLEGYYDRELRGKDGMLEREKDAKGAPILVGDARRIDPENGRTLSLWTDRTIQRLVENRLMEGIQKYGAKEGSVVVMDPATGGILALAAYPSYDPANFVQFDKTVYKNPVVSGSYEPGSTFKALVMAAALNEKVLTPGTTMEEQGPVNVGEYTIRTWNNQYHGTITMTQVLERSSNIGMVYVGRKLGRDKLVKYLHDFGFGSPTRIDIEEESSPEIRQRSEWGDIDLATASFGQGIAVTPIQMVTAIGSLANGGWLMEPHMVKEIQDSKGQSLIKPQKVRRVVSSEVAKTVTEMMVSAVDNGEAKWAKPKGYRIAGKTGTAQIPVSGHYDEQKTIASFVGFAPADNPKFVMLVTLREPASSPWGSETAAPLFFTIARELFSYWGLPAQ